MLTSPALMRLERYFLSAFPQLFALMFGVGGIGEGGSGGAVVCAVVVGGGCGCGGGVSRYYLDKNDNFACHVTFAGRKSAIFEKWTQKYKNFLLHSKVKKIRFGFLPPKKPVICYTTVPESLTAVPVVWYNSCNFCWLK